MKWVRDRTGRFPQRPYYEGLELDSECENIISSFLIEKYGKVTLPISTNDLTVGESESQKAESTLVNVGKLTTETLAEQLTFFPVFATGNSQRWMRLILSSFVHTRKYRNLLHCVVSMARSKWLGTPRSHADSSAVECHELTKAICSSTLFSKKPS